MNRLLLPYELHVNFLLSEHYISEDSRLDVHRVHIFVRIAYSIPYQLNILLQSMILVI